MRILLIALGAILGTSAAAAQSPTHWMLELNLGDRRIEGAPLAWSPRVVHLLGRDGHLWQFAPSQARDYRRTAERFEAYSVSELRAMLLRELGDGFEVTGTSHYVVAHPRGQRDRWAQRFEDLYRSFIHYFAVRGLRLEEPPFPLIGIVCRDREEFVRHAARRGEATAAGIQGYYSLSSNRITLYDTGAATEGAGWQHHATLVIHEAAHQTAFNCGVHRRLAAPPLWVAEGLATMFETPGVFDSFHYAQRSDRVNRGWLRHFRQSAAARHAEWLPELVASDRPFQSNPAKAYAEAWALTFYLAETQPERYTSYLAQTARRPSLEPYTAPERTADFTALFGEDWRMLEARLLRFLKELD